MQDLSGAFTHFHICVDKHGTNMIELNEGQKAAAEGVVKSFLSRETQGAIVIGEGGTGKTTSIMWAAQKLLDAGLRILFCAPTNKALKELERSAAAFGLSGVFEFYTFHKALGLALLPDEENKYAAQVGKGCVEEFDLILGDELSMLSKIMLLNYLMPRLQAAGVLLLGMGDDMQLPPVREEKSLAFELFPEHTYRLTKVERQQEGSEILELTSSLRKAIDNDEPFRPPEIKNNEVKAVLASKFLSTVVDSFDSETDLDSVRVLAWRNRRVDDINAAVRKKIYGPKAKQFEVGERVVTGSPVKGEDGTVILSTDEDCVVVAMTESSVYDEDSEKDYKTTQLVLKPLYSEVSQVFVHVIHKDYEAKYWDRLEDLASKAKANKSNARSYWARYHKFKELFATIKYCYCITVHRSQGSTYDKAFVDVKDILGNRIPKERKRLLNVAFSRPRKQLIVNKTNYVA